MAKALRLKYSVNTIDGQQLLPAGTELTAEVLEKLASSLPRNPGHPHDSLSLRPDLQQPRGCRGHM